ncbi:Glycine/D-amino acid oxidase [Cyclobacterium lianum]|uniref:Glycine/D-amino acid oxidase n=1 Tax=Cyclobacterium lianum TaxID=388280 RepID=A0A1M7PX08_9BACT|nr:FAD-dependent oxidoreductase [Cyclobacterium lianum]SHN22075.1 Glycine/D-amino acid oxidase [Cyclobacterium lianum]
MKADFLLIGQGLAGTILSYRLFRAGYTVHLIDDAHPSASSRVAAGLYNPVTGRKMIKTWMADILFAEIEPFYQEMEGFLNQKLLHPQGIFRPFISFEEQNEWLAKSADDQFEGFIKEVFTGPQFPGVNDGMGGLLLKKAGYVDIPVLLQAYRTWAKSQGLMTEAVFSRNQLKRGKDGDWEYQDLTAGGLIFTNGIRAKDQGFFDWLPFAPVKGEILTLRQDFYSSKIINRGVFRIDLGNGLGKVGATYDNRNIDLEPTAAARQEILDKLRQLIPEKVLEILHHQVGVRPATPDRRPILGKHPSEENVYLFGGLGAKGVSLAPYFSRKMVDFLHSGEEPQKEVNINRFFKYI